MPTMIVTISDPQFVRIVAAVDKELEREGAETDRAIAKRWLKGKIVELVFRDERRTGAAAVVADNTLVVIT